LLGARFVIGPVSISAMQVLVLGATVALVATLAYIVQRTSIGRALRAVAENRDVARLLGVPANRLTLLAFALSGALAGAAGVLISLHYAAITPYIGVEVGLKAIAVMVIGGTGRIWGALVAGPIIGVLEVMTVAYGGSQIRDFVVYGFMIAVLLLRPQGILGGMRAEQGQRV
jgi:branched-chain amino acid transport system permease protein